jgi:DNA-binding beta-propeller fold protein YncE
VPLLRSVDRPQVQGTVAVGAEPQGVAVAPDDQTVYVADQHSHLLSVLDVANRRVT